MIRQVLGGFRGPRVMVVAVLSMILLLGAGPTSAQPAASPVPATAAFVLEVPAAGGCRLGRRAASGL